MSGSLGSDSIHPVVQHHSKWEANDPRQAYGDAMNETDRPPLTLMIWMDEHGGDLQETLDSIRQQDYPVLDPWLMHTNDIPVPTSAGSDGFPLRPCVANDKWAACNLVLEQSQGEMIGLFHAGCVVEAGAFEYAANVGRHHRECAALCGGWREWNEAEHAFEEKHADPEDLLPLVRCDDPPPVEAMIFFRSRCGGLRFEAEDERVIPEYDLWLRLHAWPVLISHRCLVQCRSWRRKPAGDAIQEGERRLYTFQRFVRQHEGNEWVQLVARHALAEIYAWTAERLQQQGGAPERFDALAAKARSHDADSLRVKRLGEKEKSGATLAAGRFDEKVYWERRYAAGGTSGAGSDGTQYAFKRDFIQGVIRRFEINRMVDFGCGDGSQIAELEVQEYYGVDVSASAVERCRRLYRDRPGFAFDPLERAAFQRYDLALSLDVIYPVIQPDEYDAYLRRLFAHSTYTLVYANLIERESSSPHMRFREHLTEMRRRGIKARLVERVVNPKMPTVGFWLFENHEAAPGAQGKMVEP